MEKNLYLQMEMKLYPSHVNKNDICIDLGANIGNASLVMWIKGASKIYALEPNLEAFNVLKENIKGIENINALNIAISSETKKENSFQFKSIRVLILLNKHLYFCLLLYHELIGA